MIHTGDIIRPAWHESATVRAILGRLSVQGFPTARRVTRPGIWNDKAANEYDRSHPAVAALIAARGMWFELLGDAGGTSADQLIRDHERRLAWERAFRAAISAMRLDFPPWGNAVNRAARSGDLSTCPQAAAHAFVVRWERQRQESVRRFHQERQAACGEVMQ